MAAQESQAPADPKPRVVPIPAELSRRPRADLANETTPPKEVARRDPGTRPRARRYPGSTPRAKLLGLLAAALLTVLLAATLAFALLMASTSTSAKVTTGPGPSFRPTSSDQTPASTPTPSSTNVAGDPSGVAMPTTPVPGWREVFADDFTGSTLDPGRWGAYSGQPGSDAGGWWDPSHVSVSNGDLVLKGYRDGDKWVTGGVSSKRGLVQTYGKYLVRFRFDAGTGISHAILLWPADNHWPPEIDFSEDNGGNRQETVATLHYGTANTQVQRSVAVDLTKWHTVGVEWTLGKLAYTLDGRSWATVRNVNVPSIPMVLDIQTQAWASGTSAWRHGVDPTTPAHVNLYVDWVVAYAPSER